MTESQNIEVLPFVSHVRQMLNKIDYRCTNEYALKSFLSFCSSRQIEGVTKEDVTCWIVTLLMNGKSANTVKRYLCKLHVTYLDWINKNALRHSETSVQDINIDPFDGQLALTIPENQTKSEETHSNLNLVKKLVTIDIYKGATGRIKAFFFYLLYNPELSIADVVNLKFADVQRFCPQTVEIVESMDKSNGRKYVFPLDQPDKRVSQITREISEDIQNLLKVTGMKFGNGFTRERITAMWICTAIGLGINVCDVRSLVSVVPEEYKILGSISPSKLSEKERQDIICRVANQINDITTRWYVVNMRNRITPEIVKDSIKENFPSLFGQMYFFHPTHCIYRESKNKKKVKVETPFIPGILFIKVKSDMVGSIMNSLRNIAWGYKQLNTPDSPYSVISQRAMIDFQKSIGMFSDDIRVEMVTRKEPLSVNDSVIVHGDSIDGSIGEITEIKEKNGIKTYSIRLTHNQSFSWSVKIDDELRLEPLSAHRKKEITEYA